MASDITDNKAWILVTNDDGCASPTLIPLIRSLSAIAPVRAVVPRDERSWTSKMLSRFGTLEAREVTIEDVMFWTVDRGYPADCANIGVHNLFDTKPALAVSGINMGTNAGLGFFLSSGTVGAAVECALAGVPAAAFSICLESEEYDRWRRKEPLSAVFGARLEAAVKVTTEIVAELWHRGLPPDVSLLNVNMPSNIEKQSRRRVTRIDPSYYGPFFETADKLHDFRHGPIRLGPNEVIPNGDLAALERGEISVTAIRLPQDIILEQSEARRFGCMPEAR